MNSLLWLLWAMLLAASVSLTRNPFYLALACTALAGVWVAVDGARPLGRPAPRLPLLAGAFLLPWSTLVNALLAHVGDRVMVRLPPWPVIGGPITWNAVLYGALTGLALTAVLFGMSVLHAVLDRHELLRLVPADQRVLAVTLALALNALPAFASATRDVVEALRFRSRRRSLLALRGGIPAVVYRGMEYSLALAEVLEVRGFGARLTARRRWPIGSLLLSLGTFLVIGAVLSGFAVVLVLGFACLALALALAVRRTWPALRALAWSRAASVAAGTLLLASGLFALGLRLPESDIAYSPYPVLRWPGFALPVGVAYFALVVPAFLVRGSAR
ncbi:MAG: hypothetical protein RMK01_09970 [Thermomicrobium sp.]|nr:hypothetical protein [Thermomicrobium sp.]MDW8060388.1 hypothetical protein [Thermomicrobium sp.]